MIDQSVPERIRATIEASDYPELSVREVVQRTGLTEQQVYSAAGSMDRLELDQRVGVVRLPEDDGGEFVDDPEHELVTDGGETEQRRIEVVVKSTRRGNLATFADASAGSGIRSMTDAEIEAHDFLSEITNKIDAEAHESGDLVAEVFVDADGECSVEWADDAVRTATDGGVDESEGDNSHVGPIVFADDDARRRLQQSGDVVTFRVSERTTGDTWWRKSRTGEKMGDCRVECIGAVDPSDHSILMPYYREAGFDSVSDWQDAIADLNGELTEGYLYRVTSDGPDEPDSLRNCPACGEADAPVERLGQRIREDNVMVVGWRCLSCETEVSELIGDGKVSDMLAEDPRVDGPESSTALDEPPEMPDPPMYEMWEGVETWSKANLRYPVPGGWTIADHGKFHTTWKHDDGTKLTRSSKRTPGPKDTFVFRVDGDAIHSVDTGPKRVEMREETVWLLQFYDEHGIESVDEFRLEVRKQQNQSLADFSGGVPDA